jgi:hypothetical protein
MARNILFYFIYIFLIIKPVLMKASQYPLITDFELSKDTSSLDSLATYTQAFDAGSEEVSINTLSE